MKFVFKITVIGDGAVGKTTLIKKYTQGEFQENYISTIGAQFSIYDYKVDGDEIKLFFWDLAGQDDYQFIRSSFYEESRAVIIVCSLEPNEMGSKSMKNIKKWYNEMQRYSDPLYIILFANKVDLVDKVEIDEDYLGELNTRDNFLGMYATSAKTGKGVENGFKAIIESLYRDVKETL